MTNRKIKLITHLCCPFSTLFGSLNYEVLYSHLHCNSKYCHSSWAVCLESCQISVMKPFCENRATSCFRKKNPPYLFERVLITSRCRCLSHALQVKFNEDTGALKQDVLQNFANFTGKHLCCYQKGDFNTSVFL